MRVGAWSFLNCMAKTTVETRRSVSIFLKGANFVTQQIFVGAQHCCAPTTAACSAICNAIAPH